MKYVKNILHFIPLHVCTCLKTGTGFPLHVCACLKTGPGFPLHGCACLKTGSGFLLHVCACLKTGTGFPLHGCACVKAGFNAATCLRLSQVRTWISNAKCSAFVCVQLSEVTCGCSFC